MKAIIVEFLVALVDLIARALEIYRKIKEKGDVFLAKIRETQN